MSNVKNLNTDDTAKNDKLSALTWIVITAIIVISIIALAVFIFDRNNKIKASVVFEKAYDKILEFDKAPNIYTKQEMEKEIIDDLNKVIAKYSGTPSGKRAFYYKGHILFNAGNYEKAEKVFKLFIDKNKNYYLTEKSYYYLSYCYSENNKIDEAIKVLDEFVKKYKNSYYQPLSLYRLGNLYEIKNDKDKAIASYQAIIDKFPNSSQKVSAQIKAALLKNSAKL